MLNGAIGWEWAKFLSVGKNKVRLVAFLFAEWASEKFASRLTPGKSLFVTSGKAKTPRV